MTKNVNMLERLTNAMELVNTVKKTSDEKYIKNEILIGLLAECGITCGKRTSRAKLIENINLVIETLKAADTENIVHAESVIVTEDNANPPVVDDTSKAFAKKELTAREKTQKLLGYIKDCAESNKKRGFGYTISDFMVQAYILKANSGLNRLKGHDITPDEQILINKCYKWLKDNNYLKAVVFSVIEDENVRVYMPEYDGRTDNSKTKMIPYNQSGGYTAKKVTSFKVYLK